MSQTRNVALLSHSGAGKTSLTEAILYRTGTISAPGRVEDGTTASDHTSEEKRRKISIHSTVNPVTWREQSLNIIDTPGYADFVSEIRAAQLAADAALIVVSAVSGVAVGTERVWRSSRQRELSTVLVINKMDRDNADFFRTMDALTETLSDSVVAIQLPIGQGDDFRGIVDLLRMRARVWPDGDEPVEADIPDEVAGLAQDYRDRLVERIVETDDDLMMRYLQEEEITDAELLDAFNEAVRANVLAPVLVASAEKVMGISLLLDFLLGAVRGVEDHGPLGVESGEPPVLGPDQPFLARVFKTLIDPYLGKLSMMRVLAGTLTAGDAVLVDARDAPLKMSHLYRAGGGGQFTEVQKLQTGDIGAVSKQDEVATGSTLSSPERPVKLSPQALPGPVMALALTPRGKAEEDRLGDALTKLQQMDPTLVLERDAETHETVLWGMGHVHLEIATRTLEERFNAAVDTAPPSIAYRQTITGEGDARYRHKKQSGGAGQFAEVALRVEPLERGAGFEFVNKVVGGTIPTQFIPSCEKGVRGALDAGPLGRYGVVDVRVTVYDGKDHPVDSKDIAFQQAAAQAFAEALQQAGPVLLEPIALVRVRVPDRFTGDAISDLNSRRARILGMEGEGSVSSVSAFVPLAELQTYSADLRSFTGGRGAFSLKRDHYAEVPRQVQDRITQDAASPAG